MFCLIWFENFNLIIFFPPFRRKWPEGNAKVWVSGGRGQRSPKSKHFVWKSSSNQPSTFRGPDAPNWPQPFVWAKPKSKSGSRIGGQKTSASRRPTSIISTGTHLILKRLRCTRERGEGLHINDCRKRNSIMNWAKYEGLLFTSRIRFLLYSHAIIEKTNRKKRKCQCSLESNDKVARRLNLCCCCCWVWEV